MVTLILEYLLVTLEHCRVPVQGCCYALNEVKAALLLLSKGSGREELGQKRA